jgi:hypothetical protein
MRRSPVEILLVVGFVGCAGQRSATEPPATAPPAPVAAAAAAVTPAPDPVRPPPCPKCKAVFDGKSLDGWKMEKPESFVVKNGAIASTGPGSHLWTTEDWLDYRLFFTIRQVGADPGRGHRPSVTFLGKQPDPAAPKFPRGLFGVQLQPPHGGAWDYRHSGQDGDPKKNPTLYTRPDPRPKFDDKKWHRCEVLVKGSTGSFKAACCEIEGQADCKAIEVLAFQDPALAGTKGPFCIQIHNSGLYDEYKDVYVEENPASDELLTMK